ncbi:nuclear condensing complex subunit [Rhodocollybia butyracea]|uniref:Nuclear condensing complex subunit n=1 Tax=Rhodocollybia butyracea TaxID=206335 RepID=A0A9P5PNW5_9AGAR|nr:nuclear condensing complex subunit [Rhodocollybia butyracea]
MSQHHNSTLLEAISQHIAAIFEEAQNTVVNHHKNLTKLNKIYSEVAQIEDGRDGILGFTEIISVMVLRLVNSKKGPAADRTAKFVAEFINHIHDKGKYFASHASCEIEEEEEEPSYNSAEIFTEQLVHGLLAKGSNAKDKNIRYRSVDLASKILLSLAQINRPLYYDLRKIFSERIDDRADWAIREQASRALCIFYRVDDPDELPEENLPQLSEVLVGKLAFDPKEEVRLAVLRNLVVNEETLPAILNRTRDISVLVRKAAYNVLEKNVIIGDEQDKDEDLELGITHPRKLTLVQRDMIIRNGLGDRDKYVREAAGKLFYKWVQTVSLGQGSGNNPQDDSDLSRTVQLLGLLNLRTNDKLPQAVQHLFEHTRIKVIFNASEWKSLTPVTIFLARIYAKYCLEHELPDILDEMLPEATALGFLLHEHFGSLVASISLFQEEDSHFDLDDEARGLHQDAIENNEFITSEILKLALYLDYGDEAGRRNMEHEIYEILGHDKLINSSSLIPPCIELLAELASNDYDLIRAVDSKIVKSLLPDADSDLTKSLSNSLNIAENPTSRQKGKARECSPEANSERKDNAIMHCLCIVEAMLQLVNVQLKEDSPLIRNIGNCLIYPAMKRRKNDEIKEKCYRCLALLALVSESVARVTALEFFMHRIPPGSIPEELNLLAAQATFDMIMWYGRDFMITAVNLEDLISCFINALDKHKRNDDMRAVLCEGLVKLMNNDILVDEQITILLVENYFSPKHAHNQNLKQCLSFFFQWYCSQNPDNQEKISKTFILVFNKLVYTMRKTNLESSVPKLRQFAGMMLAWTHPKYLQKNNEENQVDDTCVHFRMAFDVVKELIRKDSKLQKEHKRILCQDVLQKLYLPNNVDEVEVRYLDMLLDKVFSVRPLPDGHSKRFFSNFHKAFQKKYEIELASLSTEDFRTLEKYWAENAFLDSIISEPLSCKPTSAAHSDFSDSDTEPNRGGRNDTVSTSPSQRGKKRRASSVSSVENHEVAKNKKRRLEVDTSDSGEQ